MKVNFSSQVLFDETHQYTDEKTKEVRQKRVLTIFQQGDKDVSKLTVPLGFKYGKIGDMVSFEDVIVNVWYFQGKSGVSFRLDEKLTPKK